jgi:hypothetical protein
MRVFGCERFFSLAPRKKGRPKGNSDRAQLNLRLPKATIERLKQAAIAEGFITEIGIHKGEPNICKLLENKFPN